MHRIDVTSGTDVMTYYAASLDVFFKTDGLIAIWFRTPRRKALLRLVIYPTEQFFISTVED